MTRFATFVVEGSDTVPINKKGDPVGGFVDPKTHSIGCGYYNCAGRTS